MRITEFPLCAEVKEEYIKLRKSGKNRASSVTQMKEHYADEITSGAEDDGLLFWIGLADSRTNYSKPNVLLKGEALW